MKTLLLHYAWEHRRLSSDHRPSAPPTSPHGIWWCASGCDVGGMDTACPECGGPMVPSHPGSVGLVTDGGLHVSR